MQEVIKSQQLNQEIVKVQHPSGLTLLLCPMKGFSTAYATFTTQYGSVDTAFKTQDDDEMLQVPQGIAHFLEHKMFENENGEDAFASYAKTGASANAYTTFDKTAYLFSCTDNFQQSLEVLLDFVQRPYFTKESVEKEQGIIGQEIKMYNDDGDWRVYFNLLGALYQNHPVRIDIAGTVESISEIDADLLYRCYHTFYNLNNMVLCVAGNFEIDTVLKVADKLLKPAEKKIKIERGTYQEPEQVNKALVEQKLAVATPLFQLGFKGKSKDAASNLRNQVLDEILADIIAGEASELYSKMYDAGLINSTFSSEIMAGRDYMCSIFSGESRDPKKVAQMIKEEISRLQKEGLDKEMVELCKRATYGRYIGMYSRVEAVAGLMAITHFADVNMYEFLDIVAGASIKTLTERLSVAFDTTKSALSIVYPLDEN
ncbi:EF-P 5-aminopentanol modification-associated protein YfmH [Youxingia wuxianensis]|uniref:Insulinase family protein n=1 Tax=Youxingia wuxianensis TaxID=2763678 RepID=A0A926ER53_9FIRM|nr:pitrilysin family protein [Youxingia wuxianensis]MBC8585127.1 insulinase family protein [Youxingia wuxianensis]